MELSTLDWLIMLGTIFGIVGYGVWKTRSVNNVKSFLLGDKDLKWWTIGLSIMATQASAITFLSTPGKAFQDGMGFAQFYFGMPIAMVIICVFFLPIYYKLNVFTAYEYLEKRFNLKTRMFTALLFLISRGLAAGITIFAPAIIMSSILGWPLEQTNLFIGLLVIVYTVAGGTKAVSVTQKQQMIIILTGMFIAAGVIIYKLPSDIQFTDALHISGKLDKLELINFKFDLTEKYTIWTGLLAGVFLFLSYFGTDQSQVQRYLSGKSLNESRLGLIFNGIIKGPMQILVLFVGILVFIFFQFNSAPLHFNPGNVEAVYASENASAYKKLEEEHQVVFDQKQVAIRTMLGHMDNNENEALDNSIANVHALDAKEKKLRNDARKLISKTDSNLDVEDGDYIFINFIINYMPVGLIGLLIAVIFSAAMSSTASELNALATTTMVDFYKRSFNPNKSDQHYLNMSRIFTVAWGCVALTFAMVASLFDNLIEAVNIIGSLFYGTILGIFLTAFFLKWVKGNAVFIAAVITEAIIISIYSFTDIAFLWLNLIGGVLVLILASFIQKIIPDDPSSDSPVLDNI
jgi:SSS family solute:Na+ symporter